MSNRERRQGRRPLATSLLVAQLAGCTSLLGIDGEYGLDGAGGSAATSTGPGSTGSSTVTAATATGTGGSTVTATGTGGAPATTSTGGGEGGEGAGGEGGGSGGSGGFDGLPACSSSPIVEPFDAEDGYRLVEVGGDLAPPRLRHGMDGFVVTTEVSGDALVYYGDGSFFAFEGISDAAPLARAPHLTAALDGSGAIALLGLTSSVVVSPTTGITALLDAKPVSDQAMRFLVVRGGSIEDYGWNTSMSFDLYGNGLREFDCEPALVAYVEEGDDDAAVVCSENAGLTLTRSSARARVGQVRAIAAARRGDDDLVVVVRDDGVFLHAGERDVAGEVLWAPPVQLDTATGTAEVIRPTISSAPGESVVVAWTREVAGARQLAGARCSSVGCCDLALHGVIEGVPALAAIERWGPALAREPGGALALAFASLPSDALDGALDGLRIVGFVPGAAD